jgi:hypothetical protein
VHIKNEYYELHGNNNSYNGCAVVSGGSCFVNEVVVSPGNDLFLSPCSLSSTSSKPHVALQMCGKLLQKVVHAGAKLVKL